MRSPSRNSCWGLSLPQVLVVTLDTMLLGFRPHDIDRSYLPFIHGVGAQVGRACPRSCTANLLLQVGFSDPVFMSVHNAQPTQDYPAFPYDASHDDKLYFSGDEDMKRRVFMSGEWMKQINSGVFRSWEDLKFLRANWDGPLVLKGIQAVEVRGRARSTAIAC